MGYFFPASEILTQFHPENAIKLADRGIKRKQMTKNFRFFEHLIEQATKKMV